MRFIGRALLFLAGLVVLLAAGAFLLPREVAVERSIAIDAPPDAVFPHLNSTQAMGEWSPWLGRDPNIQLAFSGPETGAGNKLDWTSEVPEVGNGSQEITAVVENERVETALDFGEMGTAEAWLTLAPSGDSTEVVWGFVTDTGMNPMARYFGLMMDKWVGGDYETGLANLKALVEGG